MVDLGVRFRLVELQKEELKIQCKVDDFSMWGEPALDLEGYQLKEKTQRETAHSKRGSIFWALVERTPEHAKGIVGSDDDVHDSDIIAGKHLIVCHCESHMFECAFRPKNGTALVRGYSHHIGSVFTLPAFRRRGLGSFFLKEIAKRLEKKSQAIASVLYSDIGPTFYDRLGWRVYRSTMAIIKVDTSQNVTQLGDGVKGIKLFLDDALDTFLERDNNRLMTEIMSSSYKGQAVYASLPTRNSIEWQFCLGVIYAEIRAFPVIPTQCGRVFRDDAFVLWCHNIKESTLYIVHSRFPDTEDECSVALTVELLCAATAEARRFGLSDVVIWDPPKILSSSEVTNQLDIDVVDRDDSLSSLMIFPVVGFTNASSVAWLNNEKHAWV